MKRTNLLTLVIGLGFGAFLQISAVQTQSCATFQAQSFRFGPHPRDYVTIVEGSPFVVPEGSYFVPTAIGGTDRYPSAEFNLTADGGLVAGMVQPVSPNPFDTGSIRPLPPAVAVPAGSTVVVSGGASGTNDARAWGYVSELPNDAVDGVTPIVAYGPGPEDMLSFGGAYTVPDGKLYVVTAIGSGEAQYSGSYELRVNGAVEFRIGVPMTASMAPVPAGCVLPAGATISVSGPSARVWGYLADA